MKRNKRRGHSSASFVAFQVPTEFMMLTFFFAILTKPTGLSVKYGALGTALEQLSQTSSPLSEFYAMALFVMFGLLFLTSILKLF
jgi:hypothetical protein